MRLPKGATDFVVPAGIILPVVRNGKPRTKTHSLVLELAALLNAWSVKLLSIQRHLLRPSLTWPSHSHFSRSGFVFASVTVKKPGLEE
jgi:hypothetical protein